MIRFVVASFAAVAPAAADSLRVDYATFIHIPRKKSANIAVGMMCCSIALLGTVIWLTGWFEF